MLPCATGYIQAIIIYQCQAYFTPNADRPNLVVLTAAYVNKVVTSGSDAEGDITVTGVEFTHANGETVHVAHAKKEVVLSAG
jgi:choline dehydrogenase-like flavoprotein